MRFSSLLGLGLSLAASLLAVSAADFGAQTEPAITVVAAFPEDNPFQHVVNGEKNKLLLTIENKSLWNVTLTQIGGSVHHPETGVLIKNTTTATYGAAVLEGTKVTLPYTFYSEYKPGEIRLNLWIEHSSGEGKYRVQAFDSIVSVVEPELSILDLKMISTYLMVAALLGGLLFALYSAFAPAPKRTKKVRPSAVSTPVGTVTATGAGGYQEEWIPEHHIKKPLRRSTRNKSGGLTSGDEVSGAEVSGAEGTKRKGRK